MRRLVFVESSCLVDTWSMAKHLVATLAGERGVDRSGALVALDAEAARGTDPASVHRALWSLVAGYRCPSPAGCIDRTDPLGRTASRLVRDHRRAGDTVVVVSELLPVFGPLLAEHLGVRRVVCGAPPVDADGRLADGFPGILLGPAAARAVERVVRGESADPADCVAYGRHPRDRDLLAAVGHAVHLGYDGHLHPQSRGLAGLPALTDDDREPPVAHAGSRRSAPTTPRAVAVLKHAGARSSGSATA